MSYIITLQKNMEIKKNRVIDIKLFRFIPFIKIKEKIINDVKKKKYYLFSIPIFGVKQKNKTKNYFLFSLIPLIKITNRCDDINYDLNKIRQINSISLNYLMFTNLLNNHKDEIQKTLYDFENIEPKYNDYSNKDIKKGLISVIIPVYNTELYLKKCLDGVLNQTYKNLQIICINDCSPDNSKNILNEYMIKLKGNYIKITEWDKENNYKSIINKQQEFSNFVFVDFTENQGVSVARNTGIEISTGEYIAFIDSDDFLDENFYKKLYEKAKESNADIVKGNLKYIKDNLICNEPPLLNNLIKEEGKINFFYDFYTALYKNDFLKKNHIDFTPKSIFGEDRKICIMSSILSTKFEVIDEVFYFYLKDNLDSCFSHILSKQKIISFLKELIGIIIFVNKNIDKVSRKEYCKIFIQCLVYEESILCRNNNKIVLYFYIMFLHRIYKIIYKPYKVDIIKELKKINIDLYFFLESNNTDALFYYFVNKYLI
jgi:glycosyltransferase involved in cell wall biosynthesis